MVVDTKDTRVVSARTSVAALNEAAARMRDDPLRDVIDPRGQPNDFLNRLQHRVPHPRPFVG